MTPRLQGIRLAPKRQQGGVPRLRRRESRLVAVIAKRTQLLIALTAIAIVAIAYTATRNRQPRPFVVNAYQLAVSPDRADAAVRARIDTAVTAFLAAIPQHGQALGQPTAPITLQVYGDLQCSNVMQWFTTMLPRIINEFVRTNVLRIEYHSLETDTLNPSEFLTEQAATVAAAKQNRLWNFLETFYHEQGREYSNYVTNSFLVAIAKQVAGLHLKQWSGSINSQTAVTVARDDNFARSVGFHDTPAFRIGRTGGPLTDFAGRTVILYRKNLLGRTPSGEHVLIGRSHNLMHPLSLVDWYDIKKRINELI
jgi:protein-disulfide isomerase